MTYISGQMIKDLRERKNLTQRELAEMLCVSDKTISKWETERGLPDIAILPELAASLSVSVPELLSGCTVTNRNRGGNLKRLNFYVCPICGNVIAAVGESVVSCCGVRLPAGEAEEPDEAHEIRVSIMDDEFCVEMSHPMDKGHCVSFVAYVTDSRMQMEKLYPEQDICVRFARRGRGWIYAYCNRHGLKRIRV